jgi:hypothetical protein
LKGISRESFEVWFKMSARLPTLTPPRNRPKVRLA